MNAADIRAAQRLIAQFEGDALGRHNSSKFRNNPTKEREPIPNFVNPAYLSFATDWKTCRIGEVTFSLPDCNRSRNLVRIIPPKQNNLRMCDISETYEFISLDIWEFERVMFRFGDKLYPTNVWETGWKRIA